MTQVRHRIVEFIFGAQWPHSFAVEPRITPWKAVETLWERSERSV